MSVCRPSGRLTRFVQPRVKDGAVFLCYDRMSAAVQTGIVCAAHTAVDGTGKALTVGVLHESEENDDERSDQQDHTANNFDNRHGLKRSFILIQQKLRRNTNI